MPDTNFNNPKIDEALHLLNEAAKEKKEDIRRLLSDKYSNIRDAFSEMALSNTEVLKQIKKMAGKTIEEGQEKMTESFKCLDQEVHKNPWTYIGCLAGGALLLGYILGSKR